MWTPLATLREITLRFKYDGEWTQVATYGGVTDPVLFAKKIASIGKKYNNSLVTVESNGVGVATLALLQDMGYPNLYYERAYKPGVRYAPRRYKKRDAETGLENVLLFKDMTYNQLESYVKTKSKPKTKWQRARYRRRK